jgi:hypothetical protein
MDAASSCADASQRCAIRPILAGNRTALRPAAGKDGHVPRTVLIVDDHDANERVGAQGESGAHGLRVCHLEFDRSLRHREVIRPLRLSEAGLGGLAQRPDPEVLGAGELLAVPVLRALGSCQREAEGVDVELAGLRRIGCDDREAQW